MRFSQKTLPSDITAIGGATLLPLLSPIPCSARQLTPAEALDRYLARASGPQSASSDSVFTVQIEASIPTLHKQGSTTGRKLVSYPGQVVYRGLRLAGDKLVSAVILSNNTDPAVRTANVVVSRRNYWLTYNKISDYNGLSAHLFLLNPRRERVGLFRGAPWLPVHTTAPLLLWGDLVKSPSIFIRSYRFVQDYQTDADYSHPRRLVLTIRTRVAGTLEMVVCQHSGADTPEFIGAGESGPQFQQGDQTSK